MRIRILKVIWFVCSRNFVNAWIHCSLFLAGIYYINGFIIFVNEWFLGILFGILGIELSYSNHMIILIVIWNSNFDRSKKFMFIWWLFKHIFFISFIFDLFLYLEWFDASLWWFLRTILFNNLSWWKAEKWFFFLFLFANIF